MNITKEYVLALTDPDEVIACWEAYPEFLEDDEIDKHFWGLLAERGGMAKNGAHIDPKRK